MAPPALSSDLQDGYWLDSGRPGHAPSSYDDRPVSVWFKSAIEAAAIAALLDVTVGIPTAMPQRQAKREETARHDCPQAPLSLSSQPSIARVRDVRTVADVRVDSPSDLSAGSSTDPTR